MAFTTAMLVMGIASMATSTYGQVRAGRAAKRAGEAQQQVAESEAQLSDYNAQVAELQAKDALERGGEKESRFRDQVRGLIGSQRAGFAGANVDVGYGSAADVQADAAFLGELDALTIRNNAAREAWGYKVEAEDLRRRAEIQRQGGEMAAAAGREAAKGAYIGAAGTVLGGTSSLLATRYGFNERDQTARQQAYWAAGNTGPVARG
ncbi:MAG TPA: hypothetical protein VKB41_05070 [Steroidobacteraceae bacterium]|nr:hypothetical protein [Steroidobacteraceae bacterium]